MLDIVLERIKIAKIPGSNSNDFTTIKKVANLNRILSTSNEGLSKYSTLLKLKAPEIFELSIPEYADHKRSKALKNANFVGTKQAV